MVSTACSHTPFRHFLCLSFCLLFILRYAVIVNAQTSTYHLHRDSNVFLLTTASPDPASVPVQSANLKNQPAGDYLIKALTAAYRFYLWVGVNLTASSRTNSVAERHIEGTLKSNYDSLITVPLPVFTQSITTLSPNSGPVGTSVTITGADFGSTQGTSTVKFNGITATPTSWTATSISAPVPAAATTGPVVVTVNGQASIGVTFTVTPKINSLTPTSGPVGTSVTISGTTFGTTQGTSTITFNGATATPTSWSATSIKVPVPAAATTGPVVVTVNGQVSNGLNFTVPPVISTLTPNGGLPGTNITISGTGFGATQGTSTISFNGVNGTPSSWSSTTIVVPVPAGATTGNVVVRVQDVASSGTPFPVTAPPVVTLTSPSDGATFNVPAFITLTATASDPDGSVSKVEFFVANTKIGEDTTAPYSFLWRNARAGSHSLSVGAIDNLGASTRSAAIAITVNAMPVAPEGDPCPASAQSNNFQFIPGQLGDYITQTISLAPCETIALTEMHNQMNDGNLGTNLRVGYYNNQGGLLHEQTYSGFFEKNQKFPAWTPEPFPWRGVRAPEGLPAYVYIEAVQAFGHGSTGRPYYPTNPVYNFSISRTPRPNYNIGGTTLANAPVTPYFPYTYYGSLREEENQGQYYKFRLEPGQSVRATGFVEGHFSYGALFLLNIYDAAGNLLTTNALGWKKINALGPKFYTTNFFSNPNPTATDFYVRAQSTLWPVYDFDITLEMQACPIPSEFDPNTPDATSTGPLATTSAEYQFPAAIDTNVLPNDTDLVPLDPNITGREVELWARVYRPSSLSAGPYPVILFLHGNHGTCGTGSNPRVDNNSNYSTTGVCPTNYTVVPNHRGYDYLADKLASRGYVVVSINANRGITGDVPGTAGDVALILARGRLVLRHLQRLSEWNTNGGTPASLGVELQGKLDFSNVGLMGHSRGGEGVRAAFNIYSKPSTESTMWHGLIPNNIMFKGVFELAPTDVRRDEGSALQAAGTSWNVLLPTCDGDLAALPGVRPFDRMLGLTNESPIKQKSTYTVWGANHNFYSTEWQISENLTACVGRANVQLWNSGSTGSSAQRQTGMASVLAFFRGNVGNAADSNFNKNFNPRNGLPSVVTSVTKVDRGFMPSLDSSFNLVGDDFTQASGTDLCAAGSGDDCSGVSATVGLVDNHDVDLHAARLDWLSSGSNTFYQDNWAPSGGGIDVSSFQNLDFRISRRLNLVDNPPGRTTFSIQLVLANGLSNAVSLCKYVDLRGPVGGIRCIALSGGQCVQTETNIHPILQTVRIPLADFGSVDLTKVRGVRFSFNNTSSGSINLANIRFTKGQ